MDKYYKKIDLYKNLPTLTWEEYQKYENEVTLGYIKMTSHPEDENIVILNYTDFTTYERRWNNETMTSRGLILDLTDALDNGIIYILAKPFDKFFNYGENIDYEKDIDFSKVSSVTEKMDGSLGISYYFEDEIRFATRGSFTSEQALKATEIWKDKYERHFDKSLNIEFPITMLVEIIYPDNRIVVDYGKEEKLVLLGVNNLFSDENIRDISYEEIVVEANALNMPVTNDFSLSIEKMMKLKQSISANEEGWIVRFDNGKRLKIKGDEYCQVHRIKHGMSTKAKYRAWSEGKLNDYIMQLPEEFRDELEEFEKHLNVFEYVHFLFLTMMFNNAKRQTKDKKEFAIYVKSHVDKEHLKHMFKAYDNGAISKEMIRYNIYKDYEKYEEVITWENN